MIAARCRAERAIPLLTLVPIALLACSPSQPEQPSDPTGGGNTITGRERLGWDQAARDLATLLGYSYRIYVDGVGAPLAAAACATTAGPSGFACSAPLPTLAPGQRVLELTAVDDVGGTPVESPRSAPLTVTVASSASPQADDAGGVLSLRTADGVLLTARPIAEADRPVALRFTPDGRLFVAEQAGVVRVLQDDRVLPEPALVLEDAVVGPTAGLLDLAISPAFAETRLVYVIYTASGRDGLEKRVVRLREVGNRFAEAGVVLSGIPATVTGDSAGLAFGPDGLLYVLTGQPADARRPAAPGTSSGQLLRLNPDGTTPSDNPSYSPVVLRGLAQPVAVVWLGPSADRLVVERNDRLSGGGRTMPMTSLADGALSVHPAPSGAANCADSAIAELRSSLFVAVPASRTLLRLTFAPFDEAAGVTAETLFNGRLGPVAAVSCAPDGHMYLATRHLAVADEGVDRIFRISGS